VVWQGMNLLSGNQEKIAELEAPHPANRPTVLHGHVRDNSLASYLGIAGRAGQPLTPPHPSWEATYGVDFNLGTLASEEVGPRDPWATSTPRVASPNGPTLEPWPDFYCCCTF
jgi:hypothetical protein